MTVRSRRETITFRHPFRVEGIARELPAGAYDIVSDEELIEGLSFPCYRRISTMIMVPGAPPYHASMEMLVVDAAAITSARQTDAATPDE